MYSLEQLQQKNIKQLKEIGWQLNVMPEADKRCRQNWIDAIVGVNPPLLQLLEVSPAAEAEQAQESIELALDKELPSEEEARSIVSQYFISTALRKIRNAPLPARVFFPGQYVRIIEVAECRNSQFCGSIGIVAQHNFNVWVWVELDGGGRKIVLCRPEELELIELVVEESAAKQEPIEIQRQELIENSTAVEVQAQETPIIETVETNPSVEVDLVSEPIASAAENIPGVKVDLLQVSFIEMVETSPAGEAEQVQEVIEVQALESIAQTVKNSPGVKTEVTVSESAIGSAAKNHLNEESNQNPILTGITFSAGFLARYSPPQTQIIHFQSDADGQLSLIDFEVQLEPEPPDPDDFESLDAFREAIAIWDIENPELAASIDSMCEWAPCPEEWYWPKAEILPLKGSSTIDQSLQSSVMELLIADESFITCNFFIPTFDVWCDRFNRSDEPLDTGIYARLPKPKPPSFPPTAASQTHPESIPNVSQTYPKRIPNASQKYPETIPKLFSVVAGSSIQPARSPPGGDALSA